MRDTLRSVVDYATAKTDFEDVRHRWLKDRGWQYRCDLGDAHWHYVLEKDGKTWVMNAEGAAYFQTFWETQE